VVEKKIINKLTFMNNTKFRGFIAFLLLIASTSIPWTAMAKVELTSIFTDNMVLQQGKELAFWGTALPGEQVSISMMGKSAKSDADQSGKWKIIFPKLKASSNPMDIVVQGQNIITIKNVLVGEVWLCSGQSNMDMTVAKEDRYWCGVNNEAEEVASADYPNIRVFDTDFTPSMKIETDVKGKWEVCSPLTVGHFSAAAYFFAREISKRYKIPVGLVTTAYGASTAEAWISQSSLENHPNLKFLLDNYSKKLEIFYADSLVTMAKYREGFRKFKGDMAALRASGGDVNAKVPKAPKNPDPRVDQHNPYVLYNGMVAPLVPYTIKGALWYQGESNGSSADQYREIMEVLIADWREKWGQGDFPFIYVQLANHQDLITLPIKEDQMVTVRNGQLQNLSFPKTAMVVAIDNADPKDYGNIHPKNKQVIGLRLALAARAIAYNEKIEYMGPIYKNVKVEGNSVKITFDHTGSGLEVKGDTLKGFAIAGADNNWVHGVAKIVRNKVVVFNANVQKPVAVRYGWAKNPLCNLYNKDGLPASPFRTDN
jgi:sialate O-acetylesterase